MKASTIALLAGLFCVTLTLSNRAMAQQEDVDLTARRHFAAGEYQQALDAYVDLYAKTLHPTYLRNIGRCYQNMGVPDKAISAFREYLRKAENLEPKRRAEVEGFIREMEDLQRQRAAVAAPPPPPAVDPGLTSNRVEASLQATPPPAGEDRGASPPIYTRWWFWTAVAAVAVGGVATALVLSSGGAATPSAKTTFGTMAGRPQ